MSQHKFMIDMIDEWSLFFASASSLINRSIRHVDEEKNQKIIKKEKKKKHNQRSEFNQSLLCWFIRRTNFFTSKKYV